MKAEASSLSDIPRHELIRVALDLGIEHPERLSAEELCRRVRVASVETKPGANDTSSSRGLFAVARNLLASVVERGLNLPDAARAIRDTVRPSPRHRPPLPTVTLAQIYLAQGYAERARRTLEQVLEREPDNYKALELLEKLGPTKQVPGEHGSATQPSSGAGSESTDVEGDSERPAPSGRTSATPGIAPTSQLWADPQGTCGLRDALVLLENASDSAPSQVQLYWELGFSTRRRFEQAAESVEVELAFYSPGTSAPRHLSLPVRSAVGWAEVEIVSGEVVRGCLRSTATRRVLAVGLNLRAPHDRQARPAELFCPRPRAFYSDVVERACRAQ